MRSAGMDIKEPQKKVIAFRDARGWARFQSYMSEVRTSEVGKTGFALALNQKKYPVAKNARLCKKMCEIPIRQESYSWPSQKNLKGSTFCWKGAMHND